MKYSKLFLSIFLLIIVMVCSVGCNEKALMTIKHSDAIYSLVIDSTTGIVRYVPEPEEIFQIKTKVKYSKRPLVDSMSISQEATETLLKLKQNLKIPNHTAISEVKLIHWTYHFTPPLERGDTVMLLFDAKGQFIDAKR